MQNISFIHNTGNTYTGTYYAPFCNKMPSEYSEVAMTMNASSKANYTSSKTVVYTMQKVEL